MPFSLTTVPLFWNIANTYRHVYSHQLSSKTNNMSSFVIKDKLYFRALEVFPIVCCKKWQG